MIYRLTIVEPVRNTDGAALTESSQVATMPVEHIQDERLDHPWRTTGDTDESVVFDFGEAVTLNCVAIGPRHNLSMDATVEVRASTDNFVASDVSILSESDAWESLFGFGEGGYGDNGYGGYLLATDQSLYDHIVYYAWSAETNYRYWQIVIDDPSNPDGYIQIPRMALEAQTTFERGPNWAKQFRVNDPSKLIYTIGQSPHTASSRKFVTMTIPFDSVSEDDYYFNMQPFVLRNGTQRDFYLLTDATSEANHGQIKRYYGRLAATPSFDAAPAALGKLSLQFRESK